MPPAVAKVYDAFAKGEAQPKYRFFLLFHSERAVSFDQQFYQIVCEFAPEDARAFPSFMSILPDVDLARRSRAVLRAPLSAFCSVRFGF